MTVLTVCPSLARINIADGTVNLGLAQCAVTDSAHLRSRGLDATGLAINQVIDCRAYN
jgi:hypothetical protein